MTKKEQYCFFFLILSGSLYTLMASTLPMVGGGGALAAIVFSPIVLGIGLLSAMLYFILLKRTTYVFVTEIFSMIGIGLIVLTLLTFPYA